MVIGSARHLAGWSLRGSVIVSCALALTLVSRAGGQTAADPLPIAAPAAEGFSPDRLARLDARMRRFVDEGQYAGLVILLARGGRIVDWRAWGYRDLERKLPMEKDTIVRLYSLSKMITSVAALMLVEEGRIGLDDSVAAYLPAFGHMKVFAGGTADAPVLADARAPIRIKHLFTHTSGLIYGSGSGPLDQIYDASHALNMKTTREFIAAASKLPLAHEPGARFSYGISTDVLGAVVEAVSGKPLEEFIAERICRPLAMRDTAFDLAPGQQARLATVYRHPDPLQNGATAGSQGQPVGARRFVPARPVAGAFVDQGFPAGGTGMFSTIGDYARFAEMLLNGGELDGVRILGRKTVELMTANHLSHLSPPTHDAKGAEGFGLGVSVLLDLARSNRLGSVGQFGWSGAATTTVVIDPRERLVALAFAQHSPFNEHDLIGQFTTLAYQALVDRPDAARSKRLLQ